MFVIAKDHRVTHWNKALEELSQVRGDEMIGNSAPWQAFYTFARPCMADLLVDEKFDTISEWYHGKFGKSKLIRDAFEATGFFPKLGGEGKWLHFTAAVIRNSKGEMVGAVETLEDITDRKLAEEAFDEAQQQLANIVDFLPDATFVIDDQGLVIAWNRAMEELTGFKASAMLGKGDYEYALPFYGKRRPVLIDLVLGPQEEIETKYVNLERKGSVLAGETYTQELPGGGNYLFCMASVLKDSKGNVVGAIESIRDITERKGMEEAIANAEEKYRSIFENAVDGIFQTTPTDRIISANPAFARILRYDSPDEMIATVTDISKQLYVVPNRCAELFQLVEKEGVVREFEARFYRKDKSIAWITLNARAVHDENGRILYLEGIVQDITDRKALETRLFQAQKMDAIGTLAGGIAHDFNNLLVPIVGYTELALNKTFQDNRTRTNLQQVLTSALRAKDLVQQILAFSRHTEQERKPLQMSNLVQEALKLIRASLPSTIEIRLHIPSDAALSMVMADPTQMHQVIMNLCVNAGHAMSKRGGLLEVEMSNEEIDPLSEMHSGNLESESCLRISVRDTGSGMDTATVKRIFDPYFTTKKSGEGTGLGLAVVYSIVKNYDGAILVESEPGKGSSFHVYLPRVEMTAPLGAEMATKLQRGSGRILAVDDDATILELEQQIFEELGYEVVTRSSSVEALELFKLQPDQFDLVFTDHTMPQMTGLDLAREIFRINSGVPIVLCSGYSDVVATKRAQEIGIKAIVSKPLIIKEVAGILFKFLNKSL
jgi:PAS domain S-box-containing protein